MTRFKVKSCFRNTVLFGLTALILLVANSLTVMGGFYYEPACDLMFAANILLNLAIVWDLLTNVRRDFPLLIFIGTYNVLLLGRVYVSFLAYHSQLLFYLEAKTYRELFIALQVVTLSLLFVYLAYKAAGPLFFRREKALRANGREAVSQNLLLPVIRQISVIVLLISSLAFFYMLLEAILNVLKNGYLRSFTQISDKDVPSVISRLSLFFTPSFAVFLSTLPDKKQLRLPMAVYGVYMLASLFTGRRNTFVCEALMILIYFVLRDNLLEKQKRVLKRKTVLWGAVILVTAVYLLQLIAEIRVGSAVLSKGFFETFVSFFFSQGASFRVVVQTVNEWDLFNHSASWQYLFYPFEIFAHNNVVIGGLFGMTPIIEVQNVAFVSSTHNFAHVLTYMVDPSRYLAGGGFGTSFVAEAYVAYGMPGAAAVSMLVGLIFRFFSSMLTRPWPILASCLIALKDFVFIPRSFAFLWVTNVLNLTYICFYIGVYFIALFMVRFKTHVRPSDGTFDRAARLGGDP